MTTEPNPAPVSQMAREAAADLSLAICPRDTAGAEWLRKGNLPDAAGNVADNGFWTQAFARFEQAIRSTQVAEASNG